MEEFRGRLDDARRLFREGRGAMEKGRGANPNGPRFMREWALFEKRAGDLKVSQCSSSFKQAEAKTDFLIAVHMLNDSKWHHCSSSLKQAEAKMDFLIAVHMLNDSK